MERIARFVYKRSRLIIILVFILNIAAMASFFRFKLDTDFLSFFTSGNPRAEEFDRLKGKYETGEAIFILIEQKGSLLEQENLQKLFRLQKEIEKLTGVSRVESFIPDEIPVGSRLFQLDEDFIDRHSDILEDFIKANRFLTSQFLSADESKTVLVANLEFDAAPGEVVKSLEETVRSEEQSEEGWTLSLAGDEIIKGTLTNYLLRIIFILPPGAFLLMLLVFSLIIRSGKFSIIAVIPAGLGALWTIGTVFWSGQELNLLTIISPIFVIVMGAADGLHYTSHFLDNLSKYSDRRQLTVATLDMVGMPIFLTSITTMAGFASLTWTEVLPMRQMGIFVSLGIGYAGVLSLFFLPAVLSRIKLPSKPPASRESSLTRSILAASRHKVMIPVSFTAIIIISVFYIPGVEVVSNQLMFFKADSEIRQTFNRVEKHFGGALPLTAEIVSNRGINTLRDYKFAEDILDIERELERLPGIESVLSPFDMVVNINKMVTGQDDYPENPQFIQRLITRIDDEELESWVLDDGLRMMIRTDDLEALDIDKLEEFIAAQPGIRSLTGMPVLFDEMNKLVVESQIRSLGLALALIFIMLLLTIRKLKAALVAMLPIIITLTAILGMLSITGFNLNIVTANLSAIAVGVGVDYAIHLIHGIYYFRKQGLSSTDSVDSALLSLSRPILANAFGLAIGLSVFFFSPLRIHMQVASIMWVAMVTSSTGALLLIPLFYSGRNKPPRGGPPQKVAIL
ncbi:MAG: MMPL family transporter [Dehalococcoidales bacterium]|nr:MMPL family transporter [Dehalococcoidales bacterium]